MSRDSYLPEENSHVHPSRQYRDEDDEYEARRQVEIDDAWEKEKEDAKRSVPSNENVQRAPKAHGGS